MADINVDVDLQDLADDKKKLKNIEASGGPEAKEAASLRETLEQFEKILKATKETIVSAIDSRAVHLYPGPDDAQDAYRWNDEAGQWSWTPAPTEPEKLIEPTIFFNYPDRTDPVLAPGVASRSIPLPIPDTGSVTWVQRPGGQSSPTNPMIHADARLSKQKAADHNAHPIVHTDHPQFKDALSRAKQRAFKFLQQREDAQQPNSRAPAGSPQRQNQRAHSIPNPHNTGSGMQLPFNLGGMKGLPHSGQASQIARDASGYGQGQARFTQQRSSLSESIQGHQVSDWTPEPPPRINRVTIDPIERPGEGPKPKEQKQGSPADPPKPADRPPPEPKKPEQPAPQPTPPHNDGFPDPDGGGGESKPRIPYGPHHRAGSDDRLRPVLRNPSLAERMLALRLAGYRTQYESGDDWSGGGYNPHMNGDPEEGASPHSVFEQRGNANDGPQPPPNPPLSQRIVATRLTHYGERGYESGDDWGAGGYNPHMNGDPDGGAPLGGAIDDSTPATEAPHHGPDPDDPWSSGGYNPRYQPSPVAPAAAQNIAIRTR